MKKSIFTIILANVLAHAAVQSQGEYKKYYHDNGVVSSEGMLVNGKPDGYWKTYYDDRGLKTEGNRKDFLLDSTWKFYRSDSTIERLISYRLDLKDGLEMVFDDEGTVSEEFTWANNIKNGEARYYYSTGELHKRVPFANNKEEGRGWEYDKDGRIVTMITYRNGFLYAEERMNRMDGQGRKSGVWIVYWSEGKMREEGYYTEGKKNGVFKYFKRDGSLDKMENYRMDELVKDSDNSYVLDIKKEYDDEGRVRLVGGYNKGKKQGTFRRYDEQGNATGTLDYDKDMLVGEGMLDSAGLRQGIWKLYYPTGELRAEGNYIKGKKDGAWIFYHQPEGPAVNIGKIAQKGSYREDLSTGKWTWFYHNGTLHRDEIYRKGKEDGHAVEYDSLGNVVTEGDFIDGLKTGKWMKKVNDHTEEGEYADGERNGLWVWKYGDGQEAFEGEYQGGVPTGRHRYWYATGIQKMRGDYEGGELHGDWQYFDETGALSLELKYNMGTVERINGEKIKLPQRVEN
ncbi:MAG: hypothetical protein SH856_11920 [Flavobacteriales bacterium]|nr:hypothetical protein [Flavobacteriales bacterium]